MTTTLIPTAGEAATMRLSEGTEGAYQASESTPILAPDLIKVRGIVRVRWRAWIPFGKPLVCRSLHNIRGTRHVSRGAHRCYYRTPEGSSASPECGAFSYAVPVREIRRRFVVEVVIDEIELLDQMSDVGILAHFKAAWPEAA